MILATVGTQLPFPRLISALDDLAPSLGRVVAQIGDNPVLPKNIEYHRAIEPQAFEQLFKTADRIVAHAGIGTVLAAKKHGKPIIIFPRRVQYGEHRNDHQLATAKQLETHLGIYVAYNEQALRELLLATDLKPATAAPSQSSTDLKLAIQTFIEK